MATFDEEKQKRKLSEIRLKEEEDLAQLLSQKYKIPYVNLTTLSLETDALRLIPEAKARAASVAGFHILGKKLYVAVASPSKKEVAEVTDGLEKEGYTVYLSIVSTRSLEHAWERYKEISLSEKTQAGILEISEEQIHAYAKTLKSLPDVVSLLQEISSGKERFQTSHVLEVCIAGALATDASDIHFEPEEKNIRLRFRLDGVLQGLLSLERPVYGFIVSRIKLISGLKLNVQNEAQDGRFSIKLGGKEIEVRTSVIPGAYGETIVLRVLNPDTIAVPLEELGMEEKLRLLLEREIKKPNGMILNTGPTGSGKTTTLYAFLKKVEAPGIKIITIEDPIEYHLPGITQTQVNREKKYTFVSGLRAGLRQDPDVIMVGEIRDEDTAQTAINAALTGHLVLSTLHTNNAAGTFPRLIDLKINPKVISSALSVSIAQRLVRKLCQKCKIKSAPTTEEKKTIERILKNLPDKKSYDTKVLFRPGTCADCNNTGFKGRVGIFEAIFMDEHIERTLTENPSEREIWRAADGQGIFDMRQDGVIKVLRGTTSLQEVERVIDLGEE